jgi:tyrosyl-tRNA synthetase
LRVKYGIDPTGIDVHLGHTVPLRKLRQFQELGHTAVIIIGNYTAMVGDPSGRDETRAKLTEPQVEANARDYLAQVGRIIDLNRAEVHHNGDWFSRWSFLDVLDLTRRMTLGQITAREDFAQRIAAEKPVYLHECLYPLMQGWDSVEIRADVELGGTEQLFSLLVARDLQQAEGQEPQVAMTMPILVGTDGVRRMGKSLGNYIGVAESPENQFGKVMSIPDEPMRQYFTLLTDLALEEVDRLLAPGVNPRDAKEALAKFIVSQYHRDDEGDHQGDMAAGKPELPLQVTGPRRAPAIAYTPSQAAERAAAEFRRRAAREDPDEIREVLLTADKLDAEGRIPPFVLVKELGLETTTTKARRVIEQGGLTLGQDRQSLTDPKTPIVVLDGLIVRVGKRKIVRVRVV